MVKVFEEAVKSPIRGKGAKNIKPTVVSNEKIIVEIVHKVSDHGKAFTFHNNKGTNHGMV